MDETEALKRAQREFGETALAKLTDAAWMLSEVRDTKDAKQLMPLERAGSPFFRF